MTTTVHLTMMTKTQMITINYTKQPTGNSCGPTCLHMALSYLANKNNDLPFYFDIKHTVLEICEMCGTDWVVGTPPERMEKGMKALKIKYVEYISSPRPYDLIKQILTNKNLPILRTITQGVPHWIIVKGFDGDLFDVLDPWLGEIQYTKNQLESIWKVRDYQFFEIVSYED